MKLNYSKKILIASIVVFVVVIILDVVFTELLLGKIVSINDKVKQQDISSMERLKELTLKDSIANSEAERKELGEYFVGAGNIETVEFTKYLESLAAEAGVTEKKTLGYEPVGELASSGVLTAIRYKINISGKWPNVYNFLRAVESLPKVSYLNAVSFSLNSESTDVKSVGKVWSADLDFSVVKLK